MPFFSYSIIIIRKCYTPTRNLQDLLFNFSCVMCAFCSLKTLFGNYQMYIRKIQIDSGVVVMVKTDY